MRPMGEIEVPKPSARRASRRALVHRSASTADDRRLRDLRRIGSHLRSGARLVLREYLGALRRMGLDPVESATTLGSAFLQAMLKEARSARADGFGTSISPIGLMDRSGL